MNHPLLATVDAGAIGTALAVGFIAFMQVWSRRTLGQIHQLTNSAMTLQKKSLAQVTAAKAAITHDAKDVLEADKAMNDYLAQIEEAVNVTSNTKIPMLQKLLSNWKTTSAGAVMIIGSFVHLCFTYKTADEATWTASLVAIVGGFGLIFAGDSSKTDKTAVAVDRINQEGASPSAPMLSKGTGDGTKKD